MPNNMHNMPNDNMQNNMQINMQNMLAICRFGSDCLVLTVICRICKIICSICPICYDDFQYAQYALPTLLMLRIKCANKSSFNLHQPTPSITYILLIRPKVSGFNAPRRIEMRLQNG